MRWRILELFSGLGAWRWAAGDRGEVAAAYDISPAANRTYALNHGLPPRAKELACVPAQDLAAHGADAWLLSPPCQPYCRMGNRRDLEDPRSRALAHLTALIGPAAPERIALENVEGFAGSRGHARLLEALGGAGMHWREWRLCPTRFGIPNQRPRYFLAAAREPLGAMEPAPAEPGEVGAYLDDLEDEALYLPPEVLRKHGPGLDLVTAASRRTACFIGGYGRRFVGSGSFLRTERGVRRFSPAEVARLMGFPGPVRFPEGLPLEGRFRLLGNALNVVVARWLLGAFRT